MDSKRLVAAGIGKFLQSELESCKYSSEKLESLQVALQCIQHVFDLEGSPVCAAVPDLLALASKQQQQQPSAKGSPNSRKVAEEFKVAGNEHLVAGRFQEAIDAYTKAMELDPHNAIYYSNRAAVHIKTADYDAAVEDCQEAIRLDPRFSKAYRRLGSVYSTTKQNERAVEAFKKCLEIDPSDAMAQSALDSLTDSSPKARAGAGSPFGSGGMPDLSGFLSNPEMMSMAQNMMKSGALNDMLKDPNMMNMMRNMMGGSGRPGSGPSEVQEEE